MAGSVFGVSKDPFPSWGRLGDRPGQFHGRREKCTLLRELPEGSCSRSTSGAVVEWLAFGAVPSRHAGLDPD